jgi:hypothetical protein
MNCLVHPKRPVDPVPHRAPLLGSGRIDLTDPDEDFAAAGVALRSVIHYLAVLRAKIKIEKCRIRAGIGPKPTVSLGKWLSGPSPETPPGEGWPRTKKKSC